MIQVMERVCMRVSASTVDPCVLSEPTNSFWFTIITSHDELFTYPNKFSRPLPAGVWISKVLLYNN